MKLNIQFPRHTSYISSAQQPRGCSLWQCGAKCFHPPRWLWVALVWMIPNAPRLEVGVRELTYGL